MASEFKNFDTDVQNRIVTAAARLEGFEEPHLIVLDCETDLFCGHPGVLMVGPENGEVRLVAVRAFQFDADAFDTFPELCPDEFGVLIENAYAYLDTRRHLHFDENEVYFDVVDMAIVADSNAVVRRLVNAKPTCLMEPDEDFEREIFSSVNKRMEEGKDLPLGSIENVYGEACFMGNFAKPEEDAVR